MIDPVPSPPDPQLHQRRREILRGLTQINSLNLGVVILVAALAVIAILLAFKSREDARKVWTASVTQARASRFGGEIGWKSNALTTLARASEVRPSLALRNEAIAALSTIDINLIGPWLSGTRPYTFNMFSPDLRTVAIGHNEGDIDFVDTETGKTIRTLRGVGSLAALQFAPSGKYIAARNRNGKLVIWNTESGAEIFSVSRPANDWTFDTLAFTRDAVAIAVAPARLEFYSFTLSNAAPQQVIAVEDDLGVIACEPTGTRIAGLRTNRIDVIDVASGKLLQRVTAPTELTSIALSPAGKYLAAGNSKGRIFLWRTADGELQELEGHDGLVFKVAFDPEGKWLASCAYGGTTRLWEVSSGTRLLGTESMFIEAFGPDNMVACSRVEAGLGLGRVTDVGLVRRIHFPKRESDNAIYTISVAAPDKVIGSRTDKAQILDISTGAELSQLPGQRMRSAQFNARDMAIYSCSANGLQRWPVIDTNTFAVGNPETISVEKGRPNEVIQISADGSEALLRIGLEGAVLFDLIARKSLAFFPSPSIGSIAFSPDKQVVVTGTFHGAGTKIWSHDGKLMKDLGGRDGDTVFSPDGKWLAIVASDLCSVYETKNWEPVFRFPMNSASGLPGLAAFSPGSDLLAFTAMRRTIRLVSMPSGVEVASFTAAEPQQINSIKFSPDGSRLATGTILGNLEVWELAAMRKQLAALKLDWSDRVTAGLPAPRGAAFRWVTTIAICTLALALVFALITWMRHRQFVALFRQIEAQIEQRNAELVAAQNELFQSQKMRALGTLAAGIAHDFNNLLSIIRMSNQLTTEVTAQNLDAQENARIIERAVAQGKNVVRSMLNYSRNAADEEEFSVPDLVEQTVRLLRQQFLDKVAVTLESTGAVERVLGVPNRIEQALLNLIVNAVEAMKGSGKLRITTQQLATAEGEMALRPAAAASYVEVVIADSGPGMSAETVARIFEPFFTTKTVGRERGTGLGLSLVYGICKQDGIGIGVKSEPGVGTEFRLLIPVRRERMSMLARDASATLRS